MAPRYQASRAKRRHEARLRTTARTAPGMVFAQVGQYFTGRDIPRREQVDGPRPRRSTVAARLLGICAEGLWVLAGCTQPAGDDDVARSR